jgi:hypothetical protein
MRAFALALGLAAGCGPPYYPPPDVPRACTEPQTREALDCEQFDFELRVSREPGYSDPGVPEQLFRNASRTECGCFHNLAAAVDGAAAERMKSELVEPCRCTRARR